MAYDPDRKSAVCNRSGTECSRGAAIGAANGLVLSAIIGATEPLVLLLSAASAGAVGALIALLVWSASADAAHEDPHVLDPRVPDPRVPPPQD